MRLLVHGEAGVRVLANAVIAITASNVEREHDAISRLDAGGRLAVTKLPIWNLRRSQNLI